MGKNEILCIAITIVSIICICSAAWYAFKLRRIMHNLNHMLDAAIDNNFSEHVFDESLLSATESKLADFLSASESSSRKISEEKNKIKAMISDISHQTKTPISNMLLYTQILSEQELPQESQYCVEKVNTQTEKLRFLIDALVKLSRLETGILTLVPKEAPVQAVLAELEQQFSHMAQEKGVEFHLESTTAAAFFDAKWTVEALGNIVDNAIKYTPAGGQITISVTEYELFCKVDICDTGIGIDESEHAKVFARFYRSPSVSAQHGVGIGLYLSREILSMQGGYIKLSSRLGKGSTFSAFLQR